VWNLVFTQFNRKDGGVLEPLPFKNIDTGMGLERIASVMQNTSTNFEIDIFLPFVNAISQALDYRYKSEAQKDVLVRMIADHARAVIFAICDGVFPSNEGRGYVIRKLVRRVSLYSRRFKKQEIFLYKMVSPLARMMSTAYPEIEEKREDIALVIKGEEGRFGEIFRQRIPEVEQCFQTYAREGKKVIAGADIFKFYDTLGVPIELQEEIAAEFALTIDKTALKALLEEQKARSRKGSKIKTEIFHQQGVDWKRSGVGKGQGSKITQIVKDNRLLELAKTGQEVFLLVEGQDALAQFYGEAGGQVGDQGWIYSQDKKAKGRILNTVLKDGHPVFLVKVEQGELAKGAEVSLEVDLARKAKIAKNHTATHLLQSALRKALGTHVLQSGSVVDENHLRFDFTHPKKVEARELERVEDLVNEQIRNRLAVNKEMMSLAEAKKNGAMALFGEKYKDRVRVVSIAGFSKELCGGTHIENTQEIGFFKIISETAVAAGIRRIEALTNQTAAAWVSRERDELLRGLENKIKNLRLKAEKTGDKKLLSGIETQEGKIKKLSGGLAKEICLVEYPEWKKTKALLLEEKEALERLGAEMEKALSKQKIESLKNQIDQWIAQALSIGKTKVIIQKLKDIDSEHLRLLADKLKEKIPSLVFSLVSTNAEGKISFLLGASTDLVTKGFDAVKIAKEVTSIVGGSGGGRKDLAQAGGKDIHKLDAALAQFKILIEGLLK
jgi:alanyl-tRNA synthetase